MDEEQTAVQIRGRLAGPEAGRARAFRRTALVALEGRVRVAGLVLSAAALLALPVNWHAWPLLAAMAILGALAWSLPLDIRRQLAEVQAVAIQVTCVLAALILNAQGGLFSAVALMVLGATLLPPRWSLRVATLLACAALLFLRGDPSLFELPLIVGGVVAAYAFGYLQVKQWRTLWADRESMAALKERLEQVSAAQEVMLARKEEEFVEQQQKMIKQDRWAHLGQVATGIAHEIKNPLQAAMADLDTARLTRDLGLLKDVKTSLQRIQYIVRDVSLLRAPSSQEPSAYDLRPLLSASLRGARMGLKRLKVTTGAIPSVVVSANQSRLVEVFANLLTNAWHAIESRGRGEVRVHAVLTARQVLVYVDDDGPGIPTEALESVFEYFRSTKAPGKGTGLGLSISRSSLQHMGGDLWAETGSELGGARLVVALPYAEAGAERAEVATPSPAIRRQPAPDTLEPSPEPPPARMPRDPTITHNDEASSGAGLRGTLLLVDDDAAVRRAMSRSLRREWHVLEASGSVDARNLARRQSIDVVLCDMNLHHEDAADVLEVLVRIDPELPERTVFITAEPTWKRMVALASANPERMIIKPFNRNDLRRTLLFAMERQLPELVWIDDAPTPPSIGGLDPVWSFEPPTEEIIVDKGT